MVTLLILLVAIPSYFLNISNNQDKLSERNPLNKSFSERSDLTNTENEVDQVNGDPVATPQKAHDVYFGPVPLKGSSYINEQLDSYVKENQYSPGGSQTSTSGSRNSHESFLSELLKNPITAVQKLSYSFTSGYMNNNKQTTLIKLVDAVSRYYVSYTKFPASDSMSYDWIKEMVDKNEVSGVYEYVLETTSPVSYCGTVTQTGYCYQTDGQNSIIYVRLDSPADNDICVDSGYFFLWSSADNKLGMVCLDNEPTKLSNFDYLPR